MSEIELKLDRNLRSASDFAHPELGKRPASGAWSGASDPALAVPASIIEPCRQIIEGLPEQIAILDEHWTILMVNAAWVRMAEEYGYFLLGPGANYLKFCEAFQNQGRSVAQQVIDGLHSISAGRQDRFQCIYNGFDRWEGRTFQLAIRRFEIGGIKLAAATRYDVTELVELRVMRERIGGSVLACQEEERRRMGREIHDSTSQLLTGLQLSLMHMRQLHPAQKYDALLTDMETILVQAQREIRAISYLAHPPVLEELSLTEALTTMTEGFARRTGIRVTAELDPLPRRLSLAASSAMYRVVQEALSNVHRHAQASRAVVRLIRRREMLHLIIADDGIGLAVPHLAKAPVGVGPAGMSARMEELGGRLSIRNGIVGAVVVASLPIEPHIRATRDLALPG